MSHDRDHLTTTHTMLVFSTKIVQTGRKRPNVNLTIKCNKLLPIHQWPTLRCLVPFGGGFYITLWIIWPFIRVQERRSSQFPFYTCFKTPWEHQRSRKNRIVAQNTLSPRMRFTKQKQKYFFRFEFVFPGLLVLLFRSRFRFHYAWTDSYLEVKLR